MSPALKKDNVFWFGGVFFAVFAVTALPHFFATTVLGLTTATAQALYWALNAVGWGATAVSIVASFGLGTALAGTIWGLVKKWALRQFVAW